MSNNFLWNRKRRLEMPGLRSQTVRGQRSYDLGNGVGVERE